MDAPIDTLVERQAGVLRLTLNRPAAGNAIRSEAVPTLAQFFRQAQVDGSVRCLVVQGAGKHLCTGGDVRAFAAQLHQGAPALQADFAERMRRVAELVEVIADFDRPLIVRCRGAVAGAGLLFALAADWVLADETAQFVFAQGRLGLSPDGGITHLLTRIMPARAAAQLLLASKVVKAAEALALGLASRVEAPEALDEATERLAAQLAASPQTAIKTAKRLIYAAPFTPQADQLAAERMGIIACVGDPDFAEGVTAFVENRAAAFPSAQD